MKAMPYSRGASVPPWLWTDLKALHAKIGQQALEIDFLVSALGKAEKPGAKR
jgi:hypothetical protein